MEHRVREEIARNLAHYRKRKAWTQEELSARIGVKRTTISSWEKATNGIDVDDLFRLCQALEISVSDLFGVYANASLPGVTPQEQRFLRDYRSLPTEGKKVIHAVLEVYTTRC